MSETYTKAEVEALMRWAADELVNHYEPLIGRIVNVLCPTCLDAVEKIAEELGDA